MVGHRRDPVADRSGGRQDRRGRPQRAASCLRRRDRASWRSRASAFSVARRLVAGQRVARRRVRPAQPASTGTCRSSSSAFFDQPADRPADVARDRRPAVGALLPRLRPRVHRPERADDPARRRWRCSRSSPALAALALIAGAVRGARRRALRAPLAAGAAGGPAAHRRADRRRRGERLRRARGQGVRRARSASSSASATSRRSACSTQLDVRHAPARVLQPVHRLPAEPRASPSCWSSAGARWRRER